MGGDGGGMRENFSEYEKMLWWEYLESLYIPSDNQDLEKRFKADCSMPSFNQFKEEIKWCEPIRKSSDYRDVLETKCKYCGKWFIPTVKAIQMKVE